MPRPKVWALAAMFLLTATAWGAAADGWSIDREVRGHFAAELPDGSGLAVSAIERSRGRHLGLDRFHIDQLLLLRLSAGDWTLKTRCEGTLDFRYQECTFSLAPRSAGNGLTVHSVTREGEGHEEYTVHLGSQSRTFRASAVGAVPEFLRFAELPALCEVIRQLGEAGSELERIGLDRRLMQLLLGNLPYAELPTRRSGRLVDLGTNCAFDAEFDEPCRVDGRHPGRTVDPAGVPRYPLSAASPVARTMDPTRELVVTASIPGPYLIQWLEPHEDVVLNPAEQTVVLSPTATIAVSAQDQLLRFVDPSGSPKTFLVAGGSSALRLTLPEFRDGGEIWGRFGEAHFLPVEVRIRGEGLTETVPVDSHRFFARAGLGPGRYMVEPVFRGGITGPTWSVELHQAESHGHVPIALPDSGALVTDLDSVFCTNEAGGLSLMLASIHEGHPTSEQWVWEDTLEPGECRRELQGIEPGGYVVQLRDTLRNIPISWTKVEIGAGRFAHANLLEGVVRVAGTVRASGGTAVPGMRLRFTGAHGSTVVTTEESGFYAARLPAAGRYEVAVGPGRDFSLTRIERDLEEGDQVLDITLGGGFLQVRISSQDGSAIHPDEPVMVQLRSDRGDRLGGAFWEDELPEIEFAGLEFGAWTLTATTLSGRSTLEPTIVHLSSIAPAGKAELRLGDTEFEIILQDAAGRPVAGVDIRAAGHLEFEEIAPGHLRVTHATPGLNLWVRVPGLAPICVLVPNPPVAPAVVTLVEAPYSLDLRLPSGAPGHRLVGLPGSECDVPVGFISEVLERTSAEVLLRLRDLPAGLLGLRSGALGDPVWVPVPGPMVMLD